MENEFYCEECGAIQKPVRENDRWESYSTICQKCGAKNAINIRRVKSEE